MKQVNDSNWTLGDALCDAWIACDVMCCTASILNLTAISVDRFVKYCLVGSVLKKCEEKQKCLTNLLVNFTKATIVSIKSSNLMIIIVANSSLL